MRKVTDNIRAKVTNVEELTITEEKLYKTIRKRKNWSAPGIDGIQNFRWKTFRGMWKALVRSFTEWIQQPERRLVRMDYSGKDSAIAEARRYN